MDLTIPMVREEKVAHKSCHDQSIATPIKQRFTACLPFFQIRMALVAHHQSHQHPGGKTAVQVGIVLIVQHKFA